MCPSLRHLERYPFCSNVILFWVVFVLTFCLLVGWRKQELASWPGGLVREETGATLGKSYSCAVKQMSILIFSASFKISIRNQGKSHSLEDLASPSEAGSLQGSNKSPRLHRTMSVNQRSSPRSRFSVQENRFSFNYNRGEC